MLLATSTQATATTTDMAPRRLGALRAVGLGVILFVYTWLGPLRDFPPFVLYVQGTIMLALCGWWGWKVVRRERLARSPLALPLVALLGSTAISTFFSVDPRLSAPGLLGTLTLVLFFFVICDLLLAGWSPETFVDALLLLVALVLGQALWATVDWYWSWWQIRVPEYPPFLVPLRLYGVADHPNLLAALTNLALPFAIVRLALAPRLGARLAYGLWLVVDDVVLFFTRSRGGWVAASVVIAITVGWLLFRDGLPRRTHIGSWLRRSWRIWATMFAYLALFAALLVLTTHTSPSMYSTNGGSLTTIGGRTEFWGIAWSNFLAHPPAGSGPLTYGRTYVNSYPAVRMFVAPHAHSIYLNVLTENGLIGILAFGWIFAVGAQILARAWRFPLIPGKLRLDRHHPLLPCVSAALGGYLVHGIADVPGMLPTTALLIVMLSALGLQTVDALGKGSGRLSRRSVVAFAVPLALGIVLVRQTVGQQAMLQGILHGLNGDWQEATRALDAAIAADPAFAFYYAQRGYAYGVLADPSASDDEQTGLGQALGSYAIALRTGPEHVPDLLNAAELLERTGATEQADQMLAAALSHGVDWALPALLLGNRYAAEGKAAEAETFFATAFSREPRAREMAACRHSYSCRKAALRIPVETTISTQVHNDALALLAQGRPQEALDALRAVPTSDVDPSLWLDRAEAHLALGQLAQVRYELRVAETVGVMPSARAALTRAALHVALGQTKEAISALEVVTRPQIRDSAYSQVVFRRIGLPGPLLPRLAMLQRTSEDLAVYRELARLYAEEGRASDAAWAREQADVLAGLLGD